MKLKLNTLYHLNGGAYIGDEIIEFVQTVLLSRIDKDGTLWARDKEGDEFEVLESDLSKIPLDNR